MKNLKTILLVTFVAAFAISFSACGSADAAGASAVTISLSATSDVCDLAACKASAARTVTVSANPTISGYELWGALSGGTQAKLSEYDSLYSAKVTVAPGTWDFTLKALNADKVVFLTGTHNGVVVIDDSIQLSFALAPLTEGIGKFRIKYDWAESGVTVEKMTFSDDTSVFTLDEPGSLGVTFEIDDASAGNHLSIGKFYDKNDVLISTVSELVRVYPNMTSEKTIRLTAGDFNAAPTAPSGITVTPIASSDATGSVLVTWKDNSNNETAFEVSDATTVLSTTGPAATSATITGLTRGASYTFKVRAKNDFGESSYASATSYKVQEIYTVKFYANGGSGTMAAQSIEGLQTSSLGLNTFSYPDHVFAGWAKSAESKVLYADGASYTIWLMDVSLYAIWEYTGSTYESLTSGGYLATAPLRTSLSSGFLAASDGISAYVQATDPYAGFTHNISPFSMAKYEVTYELWYTVRTWAQANGYTFTNLGQAGSEGTVGSVPSSGAQLQPVTNVDWWDCIVWCNAYTEWTNAQGGSELAYAYYGDSGYSIPLRDSNYGVYLSSAGKQDILYVNTSANGFRLPTEGEWQYAASGAGEYAYDHVSGDSTESIISSKVIGDYAWNSLNSDKKTQNVGTKKANSFDIYDLSGNVSEWCIDRAGTLPTEESTNYAGPISGNERVLRGGSCSEVPLKLQVGLHSFDNPYYGYNTYGFRVCQSQ